MNNNSALLVTAPLRKVISEDRIREQSGVDIIYFSYCNEHKSNSESTIISNYLRYFSFERFLTRNVQKKNELERLCYCQLDSLTTFDNIDLLLCEFDPIPINISRIRNVIKVDSLIARNLSYLLLGKYNCLKIDNKSFSQTQPRFELSAFGVQNISNQICYLINTQKGSLTFEENIENNSKISIIRLSTKLFVRLATNKLERLLGKRWRVLVFQMSEVGKVQRIGSISTNRRSFVADPFLIFLDNDVVVVAERFISRDNKGVISTYHKNNGFHQAKDLITEEFHLSFPFPFVLDGVSYIFPESSHGDFQSIYATNQTGTDVTQKLEFVIDKRMVDPILFEDKGNWHLLYNELDASGANYNSILKHMVSKNPFNFRDDLVLSESINSHSEYLRNGGIIDGIRKYRVGQNLGLIVMELVLEYLSYIIIQTEH